MDSTPLAGITVFRTTKAVILEDAYLSFRPLAGITVFRTPLHG